MPAELTDILGDLVSVNHRLTRVAARAARGTESPAVWRTLSVLLSTGANGVNDPAPGSDEAANLDGDDAFVARDPAEGGFDDLLDWGSIHLVIQRLVAAGRLP